MSSSPPIAGTDPASSPAKVRKFPCPQCGADPTWHPGAERLACGYCGFVRAIGASDDPAVRERPLDEELARPRDLGWGMERKSYRCAKCGAIESLEPGVAASSCAFCGTPAVVEAPPRPDLVRPAGVLPFRITRSQAFESFRGWLGSLWFRPNDLKRKATLESMRGIYVPFWFFDAATVSRWRAESGTRRGSGKSARVDWRWVSGTLDHAFDDLPVPASRGIDDARTRELEPFPTDALAPYDPSYLSGFFAEEYAVDLQVAWLRARQRMEETLRQACRAEVPGDLCRNLTVETSWSALSTKGGLLPLWIAAYAYGSRSFAYLVNGATGKAAGTAPWSWWKIGAALLAAAIVLFLMAGRS